MKDTVTYPLSVLKDQPGVQGLAQLSRNALERITDLERELAEAVAAERERCAKVCEEIHHPDESAKVEERANWYAGTWACAAAIRKGE